LQERWLCVQSLPSEPACGCALAAACWIYCRCEVPPSLGPALDLLRSLGRACGLAHRRSPFDVRFPVPKSSHRRWMMGACVLFAALCSKAAVAVLLLGRAFIFRFVSTRRRTCTCSLPPTHHPWTGVSSTAFPQCLGLGHVGTLPSPDQTQALSAY
jgi:hypothetical protein